MTKPYMVGDPMAATKDLNDPSGQKQFTLTAVPDAAEPTQVLTHKASAQVFLLIRYSLA